MMTTHHFFTFHSLSKEWYLLFKDIRDDSFIPFNSGEGLSDRLKGALKGVSRTPAAPMPTRVAPARDSALSPTDGQVSFFRRPTRCLGNCGERESRLPIRTERIRSFRSPILSPKGTRYAFLSPVFSGRSDFYFFPIAYKSLDYLRNVSILNTRSPIIVSNVNTERDTHV